MKQKSVFDLALGFLTVFLLYIVYKMFTPFFPAIFWAVVFSVAFYPVYVFFLNKSGSREASAVLVILICFLIIVGPLSYISYLLVFDIKSALRKLNLEESSGVMLKESVSSLIDRFAGPLHMDTGDIYNSLMAGVESLKKSILKILNANVFTVVHAVIDYFIMLFTMFFLLKDGHLFLESISRYLPMTQGRKRRLFLRAKEVIVATLYGGVLIGLIQGIIGGVAFFLLGVPAAVLLGFLMFLFSFIPVIGAFTIWGPVSAYLFLSGEVTKGFVMVAIGVVVLAGVVDHLLKPVIIGGKTKIHFMLIFFGVLGGMHLFGIIGFIAGPLIIAILTLSLEMLKAEMESRGAEAKHDGTKAFS